jgi:hypothetical protein
MLSNYGLNVNSKLIQKQIKQLLAVNLDLRGVEEYRWTIEQPSNGDVVIIIEYQLREYTFTNLNISASIDLPIELTLKDEKGTIYFFQRNPLDPTVKNYDKSVCSRFEEDLIDSITSSTSETYKIPSASPVEETKKLLGYISNQRKYLFYSYSLDRVETRGDEFKQKTLSGQTIGIILSLLAVLVALATLLFEVC